jgi:hypothetical protein
VGDSAAASGHDAASKASGLLGKVTGALTKGLKGKAAEQADAVSCG